MTVYTIKPYGPLNLLLKLEHEGGFTAKELHTHIRRWKEEGIGFTNFERKVPGPNGKDISTVLYSRPARPFIESIKIEGEQTEDGTYSLAACFTNKAGKTILLDRGCFKTPFENRAVRKIFERALFDNKEMITADYLGIEPDKIKNPHYQLGFLD